MSEINAASVSPPVSRPSAAPFQNAETVRATGMLIVVTVFWGLSFPLMKNWQDAAQLCPGGEALASVTIIAVRMGLGVLLLAVFQPRLLFAPSRRDHCFGALIGGVFFLGFALQVLGLAWTSPAVSAFFTSLASAWVPVIAWMRWRMHIPRLTAIGLGVGICGVAIMVKGWTIKGGDALTLLASILFAVQILMLDRLGRAASPLHFTVSFFATAAALATLFAVGLAAFGPGLQSWLAWLTELMHHSAIQRDLALLTVFCTVLAFHWMNIYQPRVTATRAALIYLLEPVFAALMSVLAGHDELTARLAAGGVLILCGNLLVESPRLLAEWRKRGRLSDG